MRFVLVLCAIFALTIGVATATAGGGNSANAKLCQKNGWQSLFDSNGGTFTNEEDCVAYAAHGGTLYTTNPNPYPASKSDCESIGGTFSTDPATDEVTTGGPRIQVVWTCNGWPYSGVDSLNSAEGAMIPDCAADRVNAGLGGLETPGIGRFTCYVID
jgi:hypothetical protein